MDKPNYVLKTTNAELMPVNPENKTLTFLKRSVLVVLGVIILGSIVFQDNLFAELTWSTRLILIGLVVGVLLKGEKTDFFPSPMEIQFYDDHFVLYFPNYYLTRHKSSVKTNVFYYDKVTEIIFEDYSKMVYVRGDGNSTRYDYLKDGTLPSKPSRYKDFVEGMVFFNLRLSPEIDIKAEIESHSPLKVTIK